jgi:hypothetical protein
MNNQATFRLVKNYVSGLTLADRARTNGDDITRPKSGEHAEAKRGNTDLAMGA